MRSRIHRFIPARFKRLPDTVKTIKPRNDWKRTAIEQQADIKAFCKNNCEKAKASIVPAGRLCDPAIECHLRKHAEETKP